MKAYSNDKFLPILDMMDGTYQIAYNVVELPAVDEKPISYEADTFLVVGKPTKESIIRTLMREKYTLIDDEIAIINNKDVDNKSYDDYQSYRLWAKELTKSILC